MNQSSALGGAVFHGGGGAAAARLRPWGRSKPRAVAAAVAAAASHRAAGMHPSTGPKALGMSRG